MQGSRALQAAQEVLAQAVGATQLLAFPGQALQQSQLRGGGRLHVVHQAVNEHPAIG